jgi:hypothetical protein
VVKWDIARFVISRSEVRFLSPAPIESIIYITILTVYPATKDTGGTRDLNRRQHGGHHLSVPYLSIEVDQRVSW